MTPKNPFEKEFLSLCELIGEDSETLIQRFGQHDEIEKYEHTATVFVHYHDINATFCIADSLVMSLQMPATVDILELQTLGKYYTFDGISLGMTEEEVISKWGEPTNHWDLMHYDERNFTTSNGSTISLVICNEGEGCVMGFAGTLKTEKSAKSVLAKTFL